MGFIANFKAKRAAKKAQAIYELEQYEWEQENRVLNAALDIFTSASKGEEPNDLSLAQKKGGATHSQNAMHLCAEHNLIKHSDIHWIPWEKLPDNNEWIITSLKVLFNFAARNSSQKIYFPEKQVRKI